MAEKPDDDIKESIATLILVMGRRLDRLYGKLSARLMRLLREQLELMDAKLKGMTPGTWTINRHKAVMAMLAKGIAELTNSSIRQLTRDLGIVTLNSKNDLARYLAVLDKEFTGSTTPLSFDSLEWWEETTEKIGRTRIRQYTRSWKRYGAKMTLDIEDAIAKKLVVGERWDTAREEVMSIVHKEVSGKQWMVDRIVRTEASAAWNGTALLAMLEEDETSKMDDLEYDPVFKKLVSTFDTVTGRDSVQLHGQTRPVDKPFYDAVNGITYMAPPNRPNDREIIVPWRESYGEDFEDYTVETADGYDVEVHGERARLLTKRPIGNDPTRPSVRDRRHQLRNLRRQRGDAVDDLRDARNDIETLERSDRDPRSYRQEVISLTQRRNLLRRKVEEMSTWIDQVEAI